MTGGKLRQYPHFFRLFHTSTPLRSVELSKEWQGIHDWGKLRQYSYFVRLFHTGGAGSEVWNRVYMSAPVKKSGRVRLSTGFLQSKYGGEYRHGRTTRFCSVWVFPRPNIKKRFSDFRATSLVFISHIFPPTGVLRTLFLILNTCYKLTILVRVLQQSYGNDH